MAAKKAKDIEKMLCKKGFGPNPTKGDHHKHFYFKDANGEFTSIYTYLSHGSKEYGDSLLSAMARQLHVSKVELLKIIECSWKEKDIREHYSNLDLV